jgi:hypothetical protein
VDVFLLSSAFLFLLRSKQAYVSAHHAMASSSSSSSTSSITTRRARSGSSHDSTMLHQTPPTCSALPPFPCVSSSSCSLTPSSSSAKETGNLASAPDPASSTPLAQDALSNSATAPADEHGGDDAPPSERAQIEALAEMLPSWVRDELSSLPLLPASFSPSSPSEGGVRAPPLAMLAQGRTNDDLFNACARNFARYGIHVHFIHCFDVVVGVTISRCWSILRARSIPSTLLLVVYARILSHELDLSMS